MPASLVDSNGLPLCPVVATGRGDRETGRDVLWAGAQDYLGKDWMTPDSLTRAVECATERWKMASESREQEQQLALAFEAAELVYLTWDIHTDPVVRRVSLPRIFRRQTVVA